MSEIENTKTNTNREAYIGVVCLVIAILLIALGCIGYIFYRYTLIEWWQPIAIGFVLSILTLRFYKFWNKIFHTTNKYVGIICHIICAGAFGYMLFLTCNYRFRDTDSKQEVNVSFRKYSKEEVVNDRRRKNHYRKRKVMRYYLEIPFENGITKTLYISQSEYNSIKGSRMKVVVEQGLFGFPVFDLP